MTPRVPPKTEGINERSHMEKPEVVHDTVQHEEDEGEDEAWLEPYIGQPRPRVFEQDAELFYIKDSSTQLLDFLFGQLLHVPVMLGLIGLWGVYQPFSQRVVV